MSIAYLALPEPINYEAVSALPGAPVVRTTPSDRWSVARTIWNRLGVLGHRPAAATRQTRLARLTEQPA